MSRRSYKKASTSVSILIFIPDGTTGTLGKTGLAFDTATLTAYFARPGAAPVAITLITLAALTTAWAAGGFKELDATHMPGWYRLDLPDAALATGVGEVSVVVGGASGTGFGQAQIDLVDQEAGALNANAVNSTTVADGALTNLKIADGFLSAPKLATDTITAAKVAADAFGAVEIGADAAAKIAAAVQAQLEAA